MWTDVFQTIGAIVSAIAAAVATIYASKTLKTQLQSQRQSLDLVALNGFISTVYQNRIATKYTGDLDKNNFPAHREAARKAFKTNPTKWRQSYNASEYSYEQMISNEMSHTLQELGVAVFVGVVPLKLLLSILGINLVLDWLVIKVHIDNYRELGHAYSVRNNGPQPVYAIRRHAEWLALITFLWLQRNWRYEKLWDNLLDDMLTLYGGSRGIEKRIQQITEADQELLASSTRQEVVELLKWDILLPSSFNHFI